jgi:hypothetical protein
MGAGVAVGGGTVGESPAVAVIAGVVVVGMLVVGVGAAPAGVTGTGGASTRAGMGA